MTIVKGLSSEILDRFLTKEMSPLTSGLKLMLDYIGLFTPWQADLYSWRGVDRESSGAERIWSIRLVPPSAVWWP